MRISTSSATVLLFLSLLSCLSWPTIATQLEPYDVVLTGGHVLDPANDIDGVRDVAIRAGRVARVAANIPATSAKRAVDVTGLYVVPGLVDIHSHHYGYSGALFPDDVALPAGTTTVVDAGGPGWRNFEDYREKILRRAKTRVLTFINIVGLGMGGDENDVGDMDPAATAKKILEYPDLIVGIKNAHFSGEGFVSVERAVEAGRLTKRPVILDNNILSWTGRDTRTKLLEKMRPGDLHTHFYNDRHIELLDRRTNRIQPFMHEARRRGVLFDLGHGGGSFLWPVADRAMRQGFAPDIISTDIHASSIMATQSDMTNCMSKMLMLGMELKEVVYRSTVTPARAISRFPDVGTLGEGREADVAILEIEEGVFAYHDAWEKKRVGTRRLNNVLTLRAGEIVYDRDARAFPDWAGTSAPPSPAKPVAATAAGPAAIQPTEPIWDLLLKNGFVVDPASGRHGRFDVAIAGERIARIAGNLPAHRARTVVDVSAYHVTPGLIDLHAYVNAQGVFRQGDPRTAWRNVNPDHNSLRHGVTTVVDGGSTGWETFESFKQLVIDRSQTRVLAFLNLAGEGMLEGQTAVNLAELDVEKAADMARRHAGTIVGVRAAHLAGTGSDALARTIRAAESTGGVALVEYRETDGLDDRQFLARLRRGDILTHAYDAPLPVLTAARERGVLLDLGHGTRFDFSRAASAIRQGMLPDVVSTAMDKTSLLLPRGEMMTTLSKLLALGVPLDHLIERVTVRPARALRRPELGSLVEGGVADVAVIETQTGRFGFLDARHARLRSNRRLRAVMTIRNGEVVWDSEGLSHTDWTKAGPYTNYR